MKLTNSISQSFAACFLIHARNMSIYCIENKKKTLQLDMVRNSTLTAAGDYDMNERWPDNSIFLISDA